MSEEDTFKCDRKCEPDECSDSCTRIKLFFDNLIITCEDRIVNSTVNTSFVVPMYTPSKNLYYVLFLLLQPFTKY